MGGKSGVSGMARGISSDHELGEYVRLLLQATVESVEPAEDGLKRIRARLGQRPRPTVGGLQRRWAAGRLTCRWAAGGLASRRDARRPACRRPAGTKRGNAPGAGGGLVPE
jgi:hypothetical protein